MPTTIEDELGLGPVMHRLKNRVSNITSRLGMRHATDDQRRLDPLTVNYAVWDEMRHHVRKWPRYREVPNSIDVLVSPEDWEEYWGIDTERKEANIAAYVLARTKNKGLWIAGVPQIKVIEDEDIEPGGIECSCQFLEPVDGGDSRPASAVATGKGQVRTARIQVMQRIDDTSKSHIPVKPRHGHDEDDSREAKPVNFAPADDDVRATLADDSGFRLVLRSGDVIGAVGKPKEGEGEASVRLDVNVRLDGESFPYVEEKQCAIGIIDGRWHVLNYSGRGTKLVCATGTRLMLRKSVPYPLEEGDTLYLGPNRPLTFSCK